MGRELIRRRVGAQSVLLLLLVLAAVAIGSFVAATSRQDSALASGDAERMLADFRAAAGRNDWPRAIELGIELNRLVPNNPTHEYDLACAYARNGAFDSAAQRLTRAAANGFSHLRLFRTDPDLRGMHTHEGYRAALAAVEGNREAVLADLRKRFEAVPMLVVLPPDYDAQRPAPLIVSLHGKGGRANDGAQPWRNVAAQVGAILLAPQAVYPMGGGFSWNAKDTNDSLGDDAEFLVRLTVELAMRNYRIDTAKTVLTGFSEGGGACRWVGPRAPYLFAGVIPMGCDYIREYDLPPNAIGDRAPRFYFMAGEHDRAAPADGLRMAVEDYKAAGFETRLRIYPGVGHGFPRKRDEELRQALDFVLQGRLTLPAPSHPASRPPAEMECIGGERPSEP